MPEAVDPESTRRLAAYSYLRPLVEGRRVLELGCGAGAAAAHLLTLGARAVVGADEDAAVLAEARARHARPGLTFVAAGSPSALREGGPYDLVLVPRAVDLLRGGSATSIAAVRALLGVRGRFACVVPSADRPGGQGLSYYDVLDALSPHFPRVRMFGQTPFVAYGVAEFDDAVGGLRVDSALVDEASEQPVSYLAVAGPDEPVALGYALVQVPQEGLGAIPAPSGASELSRRLAEAEGQIEGGLRVARAQTEEIEELRARLRRAAEDRARLDEEVARLRRSLTEADESVMTITRRSTEEMAALAQRLTAGLRPAEPAGQGTSRGEVERLQAALAARESALSERDERIAALEAEKQDLFWRAEAAEEELRRVNSVRAPQAAGVRPEALDEMHARLRAREQALEEYRRAAGAHMDEVQRLRDALAEQSAAVVELEEALSDVQERLEAAEQESGRLRRQTGESEDADRQRRSRLAELEGTLLRLQRQAALQAAPRPPSDEEARRLAELERQMYLQRARLEEAEGQVAVLRERLAESERQRGEAAAHLARVAAERDELAHTEEALRAGITETAVRGDSARLEAALAEVDRLRSAFERSEEQLWEARGRLMADRERLEALERMLEAGSTSGAPIAGETQALIAAVLAELATLESGLRAEAAQLAAVERALGEWRTALTTDAASGAEPRPSGKAEGA